MKKKNINKIWSLNLVSHKIRHSDAFLSLLPKLEDIGGYKVFDKSKHWQNIEHCLFMMNMISNSARVHLSLDPTYHELGTLSTPIYTTTESEHHKVKGHLGPVFLFYFILFCIFTISFFISLTHLRPILWNLGIVLQQALVMEPGQGDGSQTFCAETKWIRGIFVCKCAIVHLCIHQPGKDGGQGFRSVFGVSASPKIDHNLWQWWKSMP